MYVNFSAIYLKDYRQLSVTLKVKLFHTSDARKMIIPIKRANDNLLEWVMIEMQGELEQVSDRNIEERFIGDLHFTKSGQPVLIIGIHILHGKETTLPKPFAVLEKFERSKDDDRSTTSNVNCNAVSTEYFVKAIVKKKLIFRSRPKPIVTDMPISKS